MKSASISEIKNELKEHSAGELLAMCLRLSKFKKENKELLTYLLFEAYDEDAYVEKVKEEITNQFAEINTSSYYFIKKSVRKILRITRKYIRYSDEKETEVRLMIFFCESLKNMKPAFTKNQALLNLYNRQIVSVKKSLKGLHEDLQYDYKEALEDLVY